MPLYRLAESEKLVPFEAAPFPGLEKKLENWIERNPHILLEGETVAIIARQPRTAHGKFSDLLGVDESGACVIMELKRGETPRDVVAQALEYAAWVDSLRGDELDDLARTYAAKRGIAANGVLDLYQRAFGGEYDGEGGDTLPLAAHLTFNHRQRLVIVAEQFHPEVEQTLRYLRTKLGVDITGVRLGVHIACGATIVETDVVVGREQAAAPKQASAASSKVEPDEAIRTRVSSPFVKAAVISIEDWVGSLGNPALTVRHGPRSDHFLQVEGKTQLFYYYARRWLYGLLYAPSVADLERLKDLGKPDSVIQTEGGVRFHLINDTDLQVVQGIILNRLTGATSG